jgi:hypothetical protein
MGSSLVDQAFQQCIDRQTFPLSLFDQGGLRSAAEYESSSGVPCL